LFTMSDSTGSNLGEPYNSSFDDLSMIVLNDTVGYFSSNRNSAGAHDDVFSYRIEVPKPVIVPEIVPEIVTVDIPPPPPPVVEKKLIIEDINFAFDAFAVTEDQKPYLNEVAAKLKLKKDVYMVVSGHSDNLGSTVYNKNLSKKRADEVKNYLVAQGVDASRILVEFYGFDKPLESNQTVEGRAKNRRVEFKFLGEIEL